MFCQKWEMFKTGSTIPDGQLNHQLYQCCVEALEVLLNGLADEDIKKEVLGLQDLDTLSITETVARIENSWALPRKTLE